MGRSLHPDKKFGRRPRQRPEPGRQRHRRRAAHLLGHRHLGFEATGGYAPAKISGETINETNTNLLVASARLLLALSPATNRVGFFIAGGPALLARGKNPFDNDKSSTDFGGNVGLGFRFALGETGNSAVRLDLEDYLYNGDFGGGDEFQNDIVASLGLAIGLGGKAGD